MILANTTSTISGLELKDLLTITISALMLIVTIITNILLQNHWNKQKIDADLKSKSRIEWIQTVRKLTAELLSVYYRILSYEKPADYKIVQKPSGMQTAMLKGTDKMVVPVEHKTKEEDKGELLATAQEKTQLLMLYYGSEVTMDLLEFDTEKAKAVLLGKKPRCSKVDENDGKNQWMSALLSDTYTVISGDYKEDDDLNTRLHQAGEEHSRLQKDFIDDAIRAGLLYDNVSATTWKDGDIDNKVLDEALLKANNRLNDLANQKQKHYSRLDFVREATSIYLKHEWDRAKEGK